MSEPAPPEESLPAKLISGVIDVLKQVVAIEVGTPYGRVNLSFVVLVFMGAFVSQIARVWDAGAAPFLEFMPWIFASFVVCSGVMLTLERGREAERNVVDGSLSPSELPAARQRELEAGQIPENDEDRPAAAQREPRAGEQTA